MKGPQVSRASLVSHCPISWGSGLSYSQCTTYVSLIARWSILGHAVLLAVAYCVCFYFGLS